MPPIKLPWRIRLLYSSMNEFCRDMQIHQKEVFPIKCAQIKPLAYTKKECAPSVAEFSSLLSKQESECQGPMESHLWKRLSLSLITEASKH